MDAKEKQDLLDSVNASVTNALKPIGEQLAKVGEVATNAAKAAVEAAITPIQKGFETSINEIKEQVKVVTTAINAERDRERTALVTELAANAKTKDVYTAADLEGMTLEQLRKTAQLAQIEVTSFAGRTPAVTNSKVADDEPSFMAPVSYFDKTPAATNSEAK